MFAYTACRDMTWEGMHEAYALERSSINLAPTRTTTPTCAFYLAGFQDVDLFLIHSVPVLLQKSLTLVFHLAEDKGKSPEVKAQPHKDKYL